MRLNTTYLATIGVAIIVFIGISLFFAKPVLDGKQLRQYDIIQHKGMSKEIEDYREKGEQIYWTNSMFSGMPAYMISIYYKGNVFNSVNFALLKVIPAPASLILLLMVSFFIMLLCMKVEPPLAIAGAVAFAFSTYFIIITTAGHNAKTNAIAYLPALFGGLYMAYRSNAFLGAAIASLFFVLELVSNHPQMTYYFGFFLLFFVLFEFAGSIKDGHFKQFALASALLLIGIGLSVGAHYSYLKTTTEYSKYSTRGKSELTADAGNKTAGLDRDYITQWSYGVGETMTLLIPNFKGGESGSIADNKTGLDAVKGNLKQMVAQSDAYFGDQPFTAGPVYAGAFIVVIAFFGLFFVKDRLKWALLLATILTIVLSWGKNLQVVPSYMVLLFRLQLLFLLFYGVASFIKLKPEIRKYVLFANLGIWILLPVLGSLLGIMSDPVPFNPTNWFLDNVPGYDKFRAVASILIVPEVTIPLLAFFTLSIILTKPERLNESVTVLQVPFSFTYKQLFFYISGIFGLLLLLMYVMPDAFNTFFKAGEYQNLTDQLTQAGADGGIIADFLGNLENARKAIFKADVLRSLIFVVLGCGLVIGFILKPFNKYVFSGALLVLVLADLVTVNYRYMSEKNFIPKKNLEANILPESIADQMIAQDPSLNKRVLNLTVSPFNDATTSYRHKSIGGYHGAKLKKYQELVDNRLSMDIERLNQTFQNRPTMGKIDSTLAQCGALNMLNTKYIIISSKGAPLLNTHALGNGWFPDKVQTVANADEEIALVNRFNPLETAVVEKKFESALTGVTAGRDSNSYIKLTSYHPDRMVYETGSSSQKLGVFSEIYYPDGWEATIDGKPTDIVKVNYVLRGLNIPAGKHTVEFNFVSRFPTDEKKSLAFSSALALFIIALVTKELLPYFRRKD